MQTRLSLLVVLIGVVLLAYMVYAESEPGAVPLALIAVGVVWFLVARARLRAHRR